MKHSLYAFFIVLAALLTSGLAEAQTIKFLDVEVVQKDGTTTIYSLNDIEQLRFFDIPLFDTLVAAEPVDLGLSVLWASCNVGAKSPVEAGDYFAWGEVEPKSKYYWTTYNWSVGGSSSDFSKYNNADEKTVLEPEDDAAHVVMGGDWRMPTMVEYQELIDNCNWEYIVAKDKIGNEVAGYKISNKSDAGKFIFLPFAGYLSFSSYNVGSCGYYCSSSLDSAKPSLASCLSFKIDSSKCGSRNRCYGQTVRAVCALRKN